MQSEVMFSCDSMLKAISILIAQKEIPCMSIQYCKLRDTRRESVMHRSSVMLGNSIAERSVTVGNVRERG
jgi:hypothetical protein